jgi:hypothetical protein
MIKYNLRKVYDGVAVPNLYMVPMNLETLTYQRTLTYGQIKGMKAMLKLVKRLNPQSKLHDMAVNETNYGQPGSANTYRVRMRYKSNDQDT